MAMINRKTRWLTFILGIIIPTVTAIFLSILSIYFIIIPAFEKSFLESKREMIRELTNVAWSIMVLYEKEERKGNLTREAAQRKAIDEIEHLRYGYEFKDYFWITDQQPRLVMHPYSKELIGRDLTNYEDVEGKRIFLEMSKMASQQGDGFIDYTWKKRDTDLYNVPKLSFIKKFDPWGWVVGTGVYLDDIQAKTEKITNRLTNMILGSVAVFALLLLYVTFHSLNIERKRRHTEVDLQRSRSKYKALVDTATDPILMIHEGQCIFSNKSMGALLGYSTEELESLDPLEHFPKQLADDEAASSYLPRSIEEIVEGKYDSIFERNNGEHIPVQLSISPMSLGDQTALVLSAKDHSGRKKVEEELGESKERHRLLTNQLNIGVFRTAGTGKYRFLEANLAAMQLLGVSTTDELLRFSLTDFFVDMQGVPELTVGLENKGFVKNTIFNLKDRQGDVHMVSVSMVMTRGKYDQPLHCDGIIEDISKQNKNEQERENLIVELQTSLLFLNQPVGTSLKDFVVCDLRTTISKAAKLMKKANSSAILVQTKEKEMIGIVTDMVMRDRVIAENVSYDTPVFEIMSSPLIYIDDTALIFEAVLIMQEKGIKHLVVKDKTGKVVSVIDNEELLHVHRYSATFLINEIQDAETADELFSCQERIPRIIKALIDSGGHAKNITRIITTVSDAILCRFIEFAFQEIGEPPVRFAFISLGSEGRGEQTLATDQDNAIIYEEVAEDRIEAVEDYFQQFSTLVCTWLNEAGYDFCKGKVMAMTPHWCQPISVWEEYFSSWIEEATPKDLMEVSIFFDFRRMYGYQSLVERLRTHIQNRVENRDAFFHQLAENALLFRLPVDFFGNISVDSGGEHPNTFNIKHIIALIVGYARIYAIHHSLENTNTLERLELMAEMGLINNELHDEIEEAYNFLMQVRFKHQLHRIGEGEEPDNFIYMEELSYMEKTVLKKVVSQVDNIQKKLHSVGKSEIFF